MAAMREKSSFDFNPIIDICRIKKLVIEEAELNRLWSRLSWSGFEEKVSGCEMCVNQIFSVSFVSHLVTNFCSCFQLFGEILSFGV